MSGADSTSNGHRPGHGRVLVAGAGGFIGGHLVRALLDRGDQVRAVDVKPREEWFQVHPGAETATLDLTGREACREAADGVDWIFNLAADMGGIGFIESHPGDCMLSVLINTHLLMAAREAEVERYFYASSACVYSTEKQGEANVTALRESDAYPAMPEDGYGWEKLFSERMCRHFHDDFGVPTRVGRYHNAYGPHGAYRGGREKAPAAICRKVAAAALDGDHRIEIWGDGKQTRSFMYIEDCVEGTIRLAESEHVDPLNIGSSELVTIDELVDVVEDVAGIGLEREYDTGAPQGVRGRNSDNTLIAGILGWEPSVSLRDGIAPTYEWIREQVAAESLVVGADGDPGGEAA